MAAAARNTLRLCLRLSRTLARARIRARTRARISGGRGLARRRLGERASARGL